MMKKLQVHKIVKSWHKMIIILSCVCLTACSERIDICKPIDVSHAGQSVKIDFEISKVGEYQVSLLFATGDSQEERERRFKLFNAHVDGVAIPVLFRLVKDGRVFFDEKINAVRLDGWESFYYEMRLVNMTVREIRTFSLPPGRYSAVITTLEDVPAFNGIESFVEFTYYNPKI